MAKSKKFFVRRCFMATTLPETKPEVKKEEEWFAEAVKRVRAKEAAGKLDPDLNLTLSSDVNDTFRLVGH